MENQQNEIDALQKELAYYKKQLDRLSGNTVGSQYAFAQLSNISKKYISSFKLMADLQRSFSFYTRKEILYEEFMDGIFSHLFLDRVILLEMIVGKKALKPISSRGFSEEEKIKINELEINVPDYFLTQKKSLLVSSEIDSNDFEKLLQRQLQTPYFILIPLVKNQQVWGALFVGMQNEFKPLSYLSFSASNIDMFESLAGIISAMTLQLEQREIMEKERNRIARDMHDDIGAELSKISVTCGSLKKEFGVNERFIKELEMIKSSTEAIVNNIGNIIWALNPINNTTENLLAYLREYAYEYLEMHGLKPSFLFPKNIESFLLAHEVRTHIFMVIKEALHNIVKHAKATSVTICILIDTNKFSCCITDDGTGFSDVQKNIFGNGLRNMQQRITEIDGQLNIQSQLGKGSTLLLEVTI